VIKISAILVASVFTLLTVFWMGYYSNVETTAVPKPTIDLHLVWTIANEQRVVANLPKLELSPELTQSAHDKCTDMTAKEYFRHDTPDGTKFSAFIDKYVDYTLSGENLANNYTDAVEIVSAWMASPTHKENLLETEFTRVGYAQCVWPDTSTFANQILLVQHFSN
jgi:uncharacterized protein YkwD